MAVLKSNKINLHIFVKFVTGNKERFYIVSNRLIHQEELKKLMKT